MRPAASMFVAAFVVALAACEKKTPPTPSPTPNGVETIRGTERLGWDQQAADAAELATFRFAIYVDGARSQLTEIACGSTASAAGFACSGRLPAMPQGQHTLELASFTEVDGTTLESPRSAALRVTVTAALVGARTGSLRDGTAETTVDGVRLRLEVVADALDEVSDIAFAPDGRLFVAERNGVVRVIDGRRSTTTQVEGEIVALSIDPAFQETRHVFLAFATDTLTIARYREVGGILGERMILIHGLPVRQDRPAAAVGIGPDGKLYVALDDGGDAGAPGDGASLNGKLLRLNRDGTTPEDRPARSPVEAQGFRSPRALDWSPAGVLWIADGAPRAPERLNAIAAAAARPRDGGARVSYAFAEHTDPSDAVFYSGELFDAFRGNLFVAAEGGSHLLRIRMDPRSPTGVAATERLLDGVAPIRAVAVGPDGAIYVATAATIGRLTPLKR